MRHAASCDVNVQRDNLSHFPKCDCGAEAARKPTPAKWQTLTEDKYEKTDWLRIGGGRVYRMIVWSSEDRIAVTSVFVPDEPEHAR